MRNVLFLCVLSIAAATAGCGRGPDAGNGNMQQVVKEQTALGWTHFETLGTVGDAVGQFENESQTARKITAIWVTRGKREEKAYDQTEVLYKIVILQKADSDTFALVFRKPRPK